MEGLSEVVYPKDFGLPPSSIWFSSPEGAWWPFIAGNHSQHYVLHMQHFHAFMIQQLILGFAQCGCDHW